MRSKCRRSEETDPRSRPPAGSVRWAPERSSSTGETVGPPGSLRTASKRSPPSRFRSRIRRDAETCLTRRTSTPGSEAIPSPRRCVSRTPVRPCISGTVGIRTPGSQTSVGSSPRDSPGPRQIFTFTHPPLPSALITHAGDGEAMALASVHTHSSVPPRRDVLRADARAWPLPDETAALAVIDSPYSDNIAYGRDPRCLGRISCRDPRFYEEMRRVAAEARRVLVPGGILAWIIADEYRGGVYTPAGFRLLTVLSEAFEPIDTVVLVRHHDRSASPMWEHRARRFNFYLRGFKFVFILRKPVGESGG